MPYSRDSLNTAISLKLRDISQASGMHRGLFAITQLSGAVALVGGLLVAPLALDVAAIISVAGLASYGLSQLVQTQRTGHFTPLPGIPVSAGQLGYFPAKLAAQIMGSHEPVAPDPVRILPADYLPDKEKRVSYLLAHAADLIIGAAEQAQEGISFSALVDMAVRASEYAITDEQLTNPITANQLAGEVRAVLMGDTSGIEAQQRQALAQEYELAKADHAAGELDDSALAAIKGQVEAIAPGAAVTELPAIELAEPVEKVTRLGAIDVPAQPVNSQGERTDWREVFALIKDQNKYPAIAVVGPQGTGKTTLINYLLSLLNRSKLVLDPHYKAGAWPGCRVIGAGMNYPAISEALENISADVAERYAQYACDPDYVPQHVVLVLDEQTNWGNKVPGAGQFVKESLSDIRKVGYQTMSVAHAETNAARGGAVGTAKMRKAGELLIVLAEQGLAKVSLKGRETFMLRFPDPTPYTVETGEPDIAKDGHLGPAFCGADYVEPSPVPAPKQKRQLTIDVLPVKAAMVPSPQPETRWEKFRRLTPYEHLSHLSTLVEKRDIVTARDLTGNKKARGLHKDSGIEIDHSLKVFEQYGFIQEVASGRYKVIA